MIHIRKNSTPEESTVYLNLYQWTPDPANPRKKFLTPLTLKIDNQESVLSMTFDKFHACGSQEELHQLLAPAGQISDQGENTAPTQMKQIGEILVMSGSNRIYICGQLSSDPTEPEIVRASTLFRVADIWADSAATKSRVESWAFNSNITAQKVIQTRLPQVMIFLCLAALKTVKLLLAKKAKVYGTPQDFAAGKLRPFAKAIWKVKVMDDLEETKMIPWKDYYNQHYISPTQSSRLSANSNDNYMQLILESKVVFDKVIDFLQSPTGNKSWGIGS